MKKQEAILISAYTGYLLTKDFQDVQKFIDETMGFPTQTIELGGNDFNRTLQEKLKPLIVEMVRNEEQ